jgi:hypothetical protein
MKTQGALTLILGLTISGCATQPDGRLLNDKDYTRTANGWIGEQSSNGVLSRGDDTALKAKALFPEVRSPNDPAYQGRAVVQPRLVSMVRPNFPIEKRKTGEEAGFFMAIVVTEIGTVRAAAPLSNIPAAFEEAARAGLLQWRFTPGTLDGVPKEFLFIVPFDFARQ